MDSDIPLWLECVILGGCTLYAFILSSADAAFSTLSGAILQKLKEGHEKDDHQRIGFWQKNQERLFASLIIAKTVMIVGITVSAAGIILSPTIMETIGKLPGLTGAAVGLVFFLLFLIEWLPRALVARYPEPFLRLSTFVAQVTVWVSWPLVTVFLSLTRQPETHRLFSSGRHPYWVDDELHRLLDIEETHPLEPDDREMISSIIEMHETSVREVMVPRVDMICAEVGAGAPALRALIREAGHSRIPIYRGTVDHIIGIIYAKDLLRFEESPEQFSSIETLARPPYFVPETKKVNELLREFQKEKIHLAIVVDEYGGIAGLVTLEDLLEEIVGEIQDEYDAEEPMHRTLPDGSVLVDAKMNIDDLNEILKTGIIPAGFDTIGGLVYDALGRVPEPGETLEYGYLRLVIREVEGQRIARISITRIDPVVEKNDDMEDKRAE